MQKKKLFHDKAFVKQDLCAIIVLWQLHNDQMVRSYIQYVELAIVVTGGALFNTSITFSWNEIPHKITK